MARSTTTLRRRLRRAARTAAEDMFTTELIAEILVEEREAGREATLLDPAEVASTRDALAEVYLQLAVATRGTARRRWLRAAELARKGQWRPSRPAKLPPEEPCLLSESENAGSTPTQ